MNYDKIDTLLVVAGCRFEFLHGKDYEDFSPYKFAELIVKECARVAMNTDLEDVEGGDSDVLYAAHTQIKQHFGVEE